MARITAARSCYRGLVIGIRPHAVPVAAPARRVPLAGRGARIIPLRFVTANFLDSREEAEQFDPNKRVGFRLCHDVRELLISSRLPLVRQSENVKHRPMHLKKSSFAKLEKNSESSKESSKSLLGVRGLFSGLFPDCPDRR
jgi:hypothetical protein